MKKKYLLAFLFSMICFFAIAQNKSNFCKFNYTIDVVKCKDEVSNGEKFVTFNWDFTKIDKNVRDFKIEIIPIKDCFNELNALRFKETIVLNINEKDFKHKDSKLLFHREMLAKCFKWRVIVKSSDCVEITDWVYYSFIQKK